MHFSCIVIDKDADEAMFPFKDDLYDWWVVGGRWGNLIELKDGTKCDCAYIKDIKPECLKEVGVHTILHPNGDLETEDDASPLLVPFITAKQISEEVLETYCNNEYINALQACIEKYYDADKNRDFILKADLKIKRVKDDKAGLFFSSLVWKERVQKFLLGLPPDSKITMVDYHN